jgi:hypothetical protein
VTARSRSAWSPTSTRAPMTTGAPRAHLRRAGGAAVQRVELRARGEGARAAAGTWPRCSGARRHDRPGRAELPARRSPVRRVRRDHYLTVTRHSGRCVVRRRRRRHAGRGHPPARTSGTSARRRRRGRRTLVIAVRPEGTARPRSRGGSSGAAAAAPLRTGRGPGRRRGLRRLDATVVPLRRDHRPEPLQQLVCCPAVAERGGLEQLAAVTTAVRSATGRRSVTAS